MMMFDYFDNKLWFELYELSENILKFDFEKFTWERFKIRKETRKLYQKYEEKILLSDSNLDPISKAIIEAEKELKKY